MKFSIYFEQTGGFAGITFTVDLNEKNVDSGEMDEIFFLIREADFFNLQIGPESDNMQRDRYFYTISVEMQGMKNSISIYEHQVTGNLHPLVSYLSKKARQKK